MSKGEGQGVEGKDVNTFEQIAESLDFLPYRKVSRQEFLQLVAQFNFDRDITENPEQTSGRPDEHEVFSVFGPADVVYQGKSVTFFSVRTEIQFPNSDSCIKKSFYFFDSSTKSQVMDLRYIESHYNSPDKLPKISDYLRKSGKFKGDEFLKDIGRKTYLALLACLEKRGQQGEKFLHFVHKAQDIWMPDKSWQKLFGPIFESRNYQVVQENMEQVVETYYQKEYGNNI